MYSSIHYITKQHRILMQHRIFTSSTVNSENFIIIIILIWSAELIVVSKIRNITNSFVIILSR